MSQFNAFQFDHQKIANSPRFISQLSTFYCNIWRYDPNFGEFKKCPICSHYFSFDYCVTQNNTVCPTCGEMLVKAWDEDEVAKTILDLVALKENFFGAVAIIPDISDTIIGFVWGFNKPLADVTNETVLKYVDKPAGYTPYFNEIATDPQSRQKGIGSTLCKMLVSWMKRTSPSVPGYLRTHECSPARKLFEKAGYSLLCYDDQVGGGRIFMAVDKCANLTPDNL